MWSLKEPMTYPRVVSSWTKVIELVQSDSSLGGEITVYEIQGDCTCNGKTGLQGSVTGENHAEVYPYDRYYPCICTYETIEVPYPYPFELILQDGGDTLFIASEWGNFLQRTR